jgi:hypothetical protein
MPAFQAVCSVQYRAHGDIFLVARVGDTEKSQTGRQAGS